MLSKAYKFEWDTLNTGDIKTNLHFETANEQEFEQRAKEQPEIQIDTESDKKTNK